MKDSFLTIATRSNGSFKDRGSKFLAFAYPVISEEDIREILETLKKEYHDARHHCYAWRLGTGEDHSRVNDDGEPTNSAGKPILNQIDKRKLSNILVVVVRYFGGTLLGVPGLINAYRTAASLALDEARIVREYYTETFMVKFPYSEMNSVMKIIKEYDLEDFDHRFDMDCSLKIKVRKKLIPIVREKFLKLEGCSILLQGEE